MLDIGRRQEQVTEAEKGIRFLCHEWRRARRLEGVAEDKLDFGDFYEWVGSGFPEYLMFRTNQGVRSRVESWFDDEFGRAL
jgi:hypothetical protein